MRTRPTTRPRIPVADIAADLCRELPRSEAVVTGIALNTRDVERGDLYAALPGARVHGADFVAQAVERGAIAVLTDPDGARLAGKTSVPVLVVDDPLSLIHISEPTRPY